MDVSNFSYNFLENINRWDLNLSEKRIKHFVENIQR